MGHHNRGKLGSVKGFGVHRLADACRGQRALNHRTHLDIDRKDRPAFVVTDQQIRDIGPFQHLSQEEQVLDLRLLRGQAGLKAGDISLAGHDDGINDAAKTPNIVARFDLGHQDTALP